jgi:signal transduction histidine kinase/CheY-like chemotaxis protein
MSDETENGQSEHHDQQAKAEMNAEYAKERVQVQDAHDRFQTRMGEERASERAEVQAAQDRFQDVMSAERATERVHVNAAQDRFQDRIAEESEQAQARVQQAQDRFQIVMDTEQAQTQHDREHLQARLNQSQRLEMLGQLAGGVAHDFNNLLAVILNYAAFVVEDLTSPDPDLTASVVDIGQIERAANRAADLTHQLLAFARREVVQPLVLDLNTVVTEVEHLLRRTLGADILLETNLAKDIWPILADAGQFEQVLINLAVNARDAMVDGGTLRIDTANVNIDADALLHSGRHVRLRVSDTGIGMPRAIIEHAFEPFFTTKAEGLGTGLGLSTVYGIVVQAEGTIEIHSQPGLGTTFTILIPMTKETVPSEDTDPLPYERAPAGEMVLIVEDQEALREVTSRIFTRSGYQVMTASNGPDAIALASAYEGEIHLLLADVVMPHMLGKEVAERIIHLRPDIEVLFMSGYAQPVLASEGRLDRDVNLIEKPFTAAALIEKAGRILNGHFPGFRTMPVGDKARRRRPLEEPAPTKKNQPG